MMKTKFLPQWRFRRHKSKMKNLSGFTINPLFFAVVAFVWYTGNIFDFSVMFLTLIIHEAVHLLFLAKYRIAVSAISIEPFGISIETENLNNENAAVFLSAPIFNIALGVAIAAFCFYRGAAFDSAASFAVANLSLGIFNLIPANPFDGGRALSIRLTERFGEVRSKWIMLRLSVFVSSLLICAGIYYINKTELNFSIIIIGIFILYNCITEKKLSEKAAIAHFSKIEERGRAAECQPVTVLCVPPGYPAHKLLKKFDRKNYYIIKIVENGVLRRTITETQVIRKILSTNSNVAAVEC
jgi:stage IV sporulation protein FB